MRAGYKIEYNDTDTGWIAGRSSNGQGIVSQSKQYLQPCLLVSLSFKPAWQSRVLCLFKGVRVIAFVWQDQVHSVIHSWRFGQVLHFCVLCGCVHINACECPAPCWLLLCVPGEMVLMIRRGRGASLCFYLCFHKCKMCLEDNKCNLRCVM